MTVDLDSPRNHTLVVRGTTDHVDQCQICDKPNLKMTVCLEEQDADGGHVAFLYAGTTCAELVTGTPAAKIRQQAKRADRAAAAERANLEYRARNVLDAYVCVQDDRKELYRRFWRRNAALRRENMANSDRGEPVVMANVLLAEALAEAWAILPDHQPDMTPHDPTIYRLDELTWGWGCKCGTRRGGYWNKAEAEAALEADHAAEVICPSS